MRIFQLLKNNPNIRDSLLLHLFLLLIFTFGIGFSIGKSSVINAPIIVDLTEIKIAEKTNLPAKESIKKEETKIKKTTYAPPKPKPKTEKIVETEKKSDTALVGKEKAKKPEKKKQTPKPAPKKSSDNLNSLLASVEKMKKDNTEQPSELDKLTDNLAVQGASKQIGNPELALTLGQKEAIASKLRACWNIDAGAKGVLDMTVGIRTYLDRDGKVSEVEIENTARYNSDQVFRAIADSARRAVYVCDKKGDESPFKILFKHYPNEYNVWQELYLQFNPLDGGIF